MTSKRLREVSRDGKKSAQFIMENTLARGSSKHLQTGYQGCRTRASHTTQNLLEDILSENEKQASLHLYRAFGEQTVYQKEEVRMDG